MNMTNKIEIIDIPKNMAISGNVLYAPKKDSGFQKIFKNGKEYVIPTSTYCPCCSNTNEKGYGGNLKRKFHILEKDLAFNLHYDTDTDGEIYATCLSCGFDLRNDIDNHHNKIKKEDIKKILRNIHIEDVKFSNGKYYIDYQNFISYAKSYNSGSLIELIISHRIGISVYNYKLNVKCLKDMSKFEKKEGYLGIPRKFWESF